jgi:cytochrome c-type biogenesis protein
MTTRQLRLAVTVAGVVVLGCRGEPAPRVEVGQPAPSYAARTLAGSDVSTASLSGSVVLLNVWATWCEPCREEIPFLEKLHTTDGASGLRIIGVSVDAAGEQQKIEAFAREIGMTYELWHDPDQRVLTRFMSIGVPASYLIDRNGVLQYKHVGALRPTNAEFLARLDAALKAPGGPS